MLPGMKSFFGGGFKQQPTQQPEWSIGGYVGAKPVASYPSAQQQDIAYTPEEGLFMPPRQQSPNTWWGNQPPQPLMLEPRPSSLIFDEPSRSPQKWPSAIEDFPRMETPWMPPNVQQPIDLSNDLRQMPRSIDFPSPFPQRSLQPRQGMGGGYRPPTFGGSPWTRNWLLQNLLNRYQGGNKFPSPRNPAWDQPITDGKGGWGQVMPPGSEYSTTPFNPSPGGQGGGYRVMPDGSRFYHTPLDQQRPGEWYMS